MTVWHHLYDMGEGGSGKSYRHQIGPGDLRVNWTWWFFWGGGVNHTDTKSDWFGSVVQFGVCMIYPPPPHKLPVQFTLNASNTIYPPPWNRQFWANFQTHNIMLCFTKVFSAKDQLVLLTVVYLTSTPGQINRWFCISRYFIQLF